MMNFIELCHLLKKMINPDPALRVTLVEIRKHPWVNKGYADFPPCYLEVCIHPHARIYTTCTHTTRTHDHTLTMIQKRSTRIDKIDEEVLMQLIPFEFNMFEARRSILSNEQCLVTSMYH